MRMPQFILRSAKAVILVSATLLLTAASAGAATVRGRLDRVANGRRVPAVGVAVTVSREGYRSSPSYTNQQGMYYLQNIPAGSYKLEVWAPSSRGTRRLAYVIQVHEPVTDIPAISF